MKLSRREFLATSAAGATIGAMGRSGAVMAQAVRSPRRAELPRPRGPRVVVVGGGWSGLSMAKYLKQEKPDFDVVLVERRAMFMSCPMSNLWLAGLIELEFLVHSYLDAARNNGYLYLNATATELDRHRRRLYTSEGFIDYDYLVVAPGIGYDYAAMGVKDPADRARLAQDYPAAFRPGSEHLTLKRKLEDFDGGTFVLTVPPGSYRCPTAPYERACVIASLFKRDRLKAKVVLLDAHADIVVGRHGFHEVFRRLYADYIEYVPGFEIETLDPGRKRVVGGVGDVDFDDAAIYPPVRGAEVLERFGLMDPADPQKEARIDPLRYHLLGDERVYVTGDSRPMPIAKTGYTANSEARYVAKVIAHHAEGSDFTPWYSPEALCYATVSTHPHQAISVFAHYIYRQNEREVVTYTARPDVDDHWDHAKALSGLEWARAFYREMFD